MWRRMVVVAAVVVAGLALSAGFGVPAGRAAIFTDSGNNFTSNGAVNPSTVTDGAPVTISATITNRQSAARTVLVQIDV